MKTMLTKAALSFNFKTFIAGANNLLLDLGADVVATSAIHVT